MIIILMSTTKILIGTLVFILLVCGIIAYKVFFPSNKTTLPEPVNNLSINSSSTTTPSTTGFVASPSASVSDRLKNLEYAVGNLVSDVKSGSTGLGSASNTASSVSLENRIKILETSVLDIQTRIKALEAAKTTSTTTSTSDSFIPLNWSGATTSTDWNSITSQVISINPADYPGYKSMKFEVQLKLSGTGGRGYARLFNQDDNTAVTLSEASSGEAVSTWVSSGSFTLPNIRKSYYLQIKSTNTYETQVQNAQIRVSY